MLYRFVPKNRVNLVLYRVIVVCGRIFIDGFLGVVHPALPTSRFRDRRHAYRTSADEDGSIGDIPPDLVVELLTTHRKPPDVRI
jgi:hypothetical protein